MTDRVQDISQVLADSVMAVIEREGRINRDDLALACAGVLYALEPPTLGGEAAGLTIEGLEKAARALDDAVALDDGWRFFIIGSQRQATELGFSLPEIARMMSGAKLLRHGMTYMWGGDPLPLSSGGCGIKDKP